MFCDLSWLFSFLRKLRSFHRNTVYWIKVVREWVLILLQGLYSLSWTLTIILPILKPSKDHSLPSSYRPVALFAYRFYLSPSSSSLSISLCLPVYLSLILSLWLSLFNIAGFLCLFQFTSLLFCLFPTTPPLIPVFLITPSFQSTTLLFPTFHFSSTPVLLILKWVVQFFCSLSLVYLDLFSWIVERLMK